MATASAHRPVVVVTGASSGIGRAIAVDLAAHGFCVLATVRSQPDAQRLQAESACIETLLLDVTDAAAIQQAAETVTDRLAGQGLAGIVNNAGVVLAGPLEFVSLQQFRELFDVNVFGLLAVTQAFMPLIRQGGGRVVNVGSISGFVSVPFVGAYAASKFALEAMTDALRRELSPWRISVSIVDPGNVDTPIWDKAIGAAEAAERQLPSIARQLYGDRFARMYELARRNSRNSISPAIVARHVRHALTAASPRSRYYVGWQAKVMRVLVWLLPVRVVDWLIRRGLKSRHA